MMKKVFSFFMMAVMAVSVAFAETATFDFSNNGVTLLGLTGTSSSSSTDGDITEAKTATVDGVTITVSPSTTNTANRMWANYSGGDELRVYGGTISVAAPAGKNLTKITFTDANKWTDPTPSVGSFTSTKVWEGSTNGVAFTITAQCRIYTVVVEYGEGGSSGGDDPQVKELNTFSGLNEVEDGTEFKFTGNALVTYQNGKYTYVRAEDSTLGYSISALLFGELSPSYVAGDYIPAGWTGRKTTYKTQTEIDQVAENKASTSSDEDAAAPFDYSGYVSYLSEYPLGEFENDYCIFENVNLSEVDSKGNFTISEIEQDEDDNDFTATMAGYNKFGVEYPAEVEGKVFNVTGLIVHYNSTVQFVPTEITEADPSLPLWKIWYQGEDGDEVLVSDTLYVVNYKGAYPSSNTKVDNLVYVTDNATKILFDLYADWGYVWEEDWSPDFVALDCGDNAALYETLTSARVIAPKTVAGTLADNYTNPRIVLNNDCMPQTLECEYPEIAFEHIDLRTDTIVANGNQFAYVTGYYLSKDEKEYLAGDQNGAFQPVVIDRTYFLEKKSFDNKPYEMFTIIKQNEEWTSSSSEAPALKAAKPAKTPISKAVAPKKAQKVAKKMPIDADNYYENYRLALLDYKELTTAVTDVNTSKAISGVQYVNVAGVVANAPFEGVNVVITTYADGTRSVSKMMK